MDSHTNTTPVLIEEPKEQKKRSALGIGITTLVTIMVVLLLAAFSVLSLVSARSNHDLAQKAVDQMSLHYTADAEAAAWYAELDLLVAGFQGQPDTFATQLLAAGYETTLTEEGELTVSKGFTINEKRTLMVTIAVNDDRTTTIKQWQF